MMAVLILKSYLVMEDYSLNRLGKWQDYPKSASSVHGDVYL